MRFLRFILLAFVLACSTPQAWCAEHAVATTNAVEAVAGQSHEGKKESHGLSQMATPAFKEDGFITNSMLVTWIVGLGIILVARVATRKMQDVPTGTQNFVEWLVESLYDFLEGIIGSHMVKKMFWFFATIFVFILFANWFGLIPGFGTIGFGHQTEHGFEVSQPLLRGVNADLNMTLGMALIFFALWFVWALQANGPKGFILHLFGPQGDTTGALKALMIVVFIGVGFLECVTILFRPVTLCFRLYGNVFAGENMLESMSRLIQTPPWSTIASFTLPIPFYFLEVLVGLVQALVFMLLTAVFTLLICQHDDGHGDKASH